MAGLDRWNVVAVPVGAQGLDGTWQEVAGRKAIMRGMDGQVFGIVTDAYEVIQNEEAGSFLEALVGEGLAMFHTAGSLFGGRRVFVCCKLPDSLEIGPDKVDKYLVAIWGHDGTMAFHVKWTPIRVVCWNTASAAFDTRRRQGPRHGLREHRAPLQLEGPGGGGPGGPGADEPVLRPGRRVLPAPDGPTLPRQRFQEAGGQAVPGQGEEGWRQDRQVAGPGQADAVVP